MTTMLRSPTAVVKTTAPHHPADAYLTAALTRGKANDLRRYITSLTEAGVPLPEELSIVDDLTGARVQHQWVDGPTLIDLTEPDMSAFTTSVARIAGWVRRLEQTDARLDANLANFVLTSDRRLVCVDVLPPLLPSLRPPERDPWEQVIGGLCFDTDVTLCALAGYAARHVIRVLGPSEARTAFGKIVIALCPGHGASATLAATWFHTRTRAAELALTGKIPSEQALNLFTAASVLALRDTPSAERQAHVEAVLDLAKSLDGK